MTLHKPKPAAGPGARAAVPLLRASYYLVRGGLGTAKADPWLAENLKVLATMISEETARTLKILVSSTPES